MAQPNLPQMEQEPAGLAKNVRSMEVTNCSSGDIEELLQDMGNRMMQHFDQIDRRFDQLEVRMDANNRLELARALNAKAVTDSDSLFPLPLPNGDAVPGATFPATVGALRQLS
ncbi:hypothetical protein FRC11_010256, partial [Ceratobasidium sp. 423]